MRLVANLALVVSMTACASPPHYSAETFSARVIDQTTKMPIVGVSVVAQWEVRGGIHPGTVDLLHVEEAVTDADGRFRIAGWGPVLAPPEGYLDTQDPRLILFKSGYQVKSVSNRGWFAPGERQHLTVRNSIWNGRTVQLIPHHRRDALPPGFAAVTYMYGWYHRPDKCWWKSAPKFVAAVDREIKQLGGPGQSYTIARLLTQQACAPFDDFLRKIGEGK